MKNIIIVGDSFTYGHGCDDRGEIPDLRLIDTFSDYYYHYRKPSIYCWTSLLQKDLPEYNIINCAVPGNSPIGIFDKVINPDRVRKEDKIDLVIYCGTFRDRLLIPSSEENEKVTNWVMGQDYPEDDEELRKAKKYFIKYLTNNYTLNIHSLAAFMASYGYATMKQSKFLFSVLYEFDSKFDEIIEPIKNLQFIHMYDYLYHENPILLKTCISKFDKRHPNNLGHATYYENVIKPAVLSYIKENI